MGYIGNQDYTIIETHIGNVTGKDTEANILLKAPTSGELWVGTDTDKLYLADGFSWIDIGTLRGETGPQGPRGKGITSIDRTSGDGSLNTIDTYTITYSDWSTSTFNVTNGTSVVGIDGSDTEANILTRTGDPVNTLYVATDTGDSWLYDGTVWSNIGPIQGKSIANIARTSGNGLPGETDTYTITMTDGTTQTFDVYNGKDLTNISLIDDTATSLTSAWSSQKISNELSSLDVSPLLQPIITNPVNGTIDFIGNVTATYNTSESYAGAQDWVKWEVGNIDFTVIYDSYEGSSNLVSWVPNVGIPLQECYVRVQQGSDSHRSKVSGSVKFTTPNVYVKAPTLTVPGSPSNVTPTPTLSTNAFDVSGGSDTHLSTDWEILKDSDNSVVWSSYDNTTDMLSIDVPLGYLQPNTTYKFKARHKGTVVGASAYTTVVSKTADIYVEAPVLTVAGTPNSVTLSPGLSTNAFSVANGTDTHVSTDWEVRLVSTDAIVWSSVADTVNKLSITVPGGTLLPNTAYKFRAKHNGATYGSGQSATITGKTLNIYVNNPTVTVTGAPADVGETPSITTSAFVVTNGVDVHASTDYEVRLASDDSLVWSSYGNTANKLTINVPAGRLQRSTAYKFKAKHNGTDFGSSAYVSVDGTTKAQFAATYGLQWNNIADTYVRLGDAAGIPLSTVNNAFFNSDMAVHSTMKRCVLNANGTVNYYLDPTDSTKKADGTASNLTGADGNVMVQIAKFYCKYDNTNGAKQMWVSLAPQAGFVVHPAFIKNGVEVDYRYYRAYKGSTSGGKLISRSGVAATGNKTIAAFRTEAQANGTGWGLLDWNLIFAVQTLCFIEIGTFNSQAVLGNGNDTGSDYGMTTGGSNSIGNASTVSPRNDTWMSYRGIENFYADIFEWIDGINISERVVYTSNTQSSFASDVFTGAYTTTGVTLPANGYIKDMNFSTRGFIPTVSGGTDSTFVPDYVSSYAGTRVAAFGGTTGNGLKCGAAGLNAYDASSVAHAYFGAGISF